MSEAAWRSEASLRYLTGRYPQAAQKGTRAAKIRSTIGWIRKNACATMRVADLADAAGMSVTLLHRHFKAATACGPLAYQRYIRLLEARRLIASGQAGVTAAAFATGYASASQASRKYKCLFGVPPIDASRPVCATIGRRQFSCHDDRDEATARSGLAHRRAGGTTG